jgi:hypothetical protein
MEKQGGMRTKMVLGQPWGNVSGVAEETGREFPDCVGQIVSLSGTPGSASWEADGSG